MKKIFSIIILACITVSLISGCGEPATLMSFMSSEERAGKYDFNGEQFISTGGWTPFYPDEEDLDTINADRTLHRTAEVEKALNVDIVQVNEEKSEESMHYFSLYIAGNLPYHISPQHGTPNPVYEMYKSGILHPLDYIPAIDLSDEKVYGSENGRRAVTFDGLTYAYMGGIEDEGTDRGFLAYNEALIKSFGVADPQELYENGEWTFDTFAKMLPQVSDFSNETKPVYSMVIYNDPQMLSFCSVFANGGQIVRQDDSGKYVFALEERESMEALQWAQNLWTESDIILDTNWPPSVFKKGQATFFLGRSWAINSALDSDSEIEAFHFIPFPYGPSGEYGVSTASYASESGGYVFFNCNDTDFAGVVFDYWVRFDDYPEELVIDEAYTISNNYWSEYSYEHYVRANEVCEYDYFSQLGRTLYEQLSNGLHSAITGDENFSSIFERYGASIQQAIDDSLNS